MHDGLSLAAGCGWLGVRDGCTHTRLPRYSLSSSFKSEGICPPNTHTHTHCAFFILTDHQNQKTHPLATVSTTTTPSTSPSTPPKQSTREHRPLVSSRNMVMLLTLLGPRLPFKPTAPSSICLYHNRLTGLQLEQRRSPRFRIHARLKPLPPPPPPPLTIQSSSLCPPRLSLLTRYPPKNTHLVSRTLHPRFVALNLVHFLLTN